MICFKKNLLKTTIMKIILKNFRCYENSSFDFGEKGLVLISGKSGAGKSGILLGIYFALFGNGNKLTMYGKTSCSVILEFEKMIITRTKKPNRLVVDQKGIIYEDDSAQSIINTEFGETFQTTGYISQNPINSFIMMSPIEKLGFLERFAFQDTDILQIKTRCKHIINERRETLLKATSQLETASAMIQKIKEPEYMEFPLNHEGKKINESTREKLIKNLQIKYKNSNILISKCTKNIKSTEKELQSIQILETKIQSKQESIGSINEKLDILIDDLENCNKSYDSTFIKKYEEQLLFIITQKELIALQIRYEDDLARLNDMKKHELSDTLKKIKLIEKDLWKEYTEEEAKSVIDEHKQIMKDFEKIEQLKYDLSRFIVDENQLKAQCDDIELSKKELETKKKLFDKLEMQKEVFKCPSCNKNLKFVTNKLRIVDDNIESISVDTRSLDEDILKLNKKIFSLESSISNSQNKIERYKEIEKNISSITSQYLDEEDDTTKLPLLSDIKKDIEYMKKYISSQQVLEKQLNSLKIIKQQIETNQQYSYHIESLEKNTTNQKRDIDSHIQKIGKLCSIDIGYDEEEDIRNKIISEKQKKTKIECIKQHVKEFNKEKNDYEKQLEVYKEDHLKEFTIIRKLSELSSQLNENIKEYEKLKKNKEELETNIKNVEKYQEYEKALDSYKTWKDDITSIQKDEIEFRKQYGAATMLKDKILEAESIAMLNVISSINTHSQVYLDEFFPDHPISVKLVPFKESKKGKNVTKKPQINLEIEYKGMEADLTSLSGGETSRVVLAFTLALGEMFNTPIMLLDECTSNLDQELTSDVMDGIKNNFNGKLVIVIAHQVTTGGYDKVINI